MAHDSDHKLPSWLTTQAQPGHRKARWLEKKRGNEGTLDKPTLTTRKERTWR